MGVNAVFYIAGALAGALVVLFIQGYRIKNFKIKKNLYADDEALQYGVQIGMAAGYYAATGEDKTPSEVLTLYTEKLEEEGIFK